MFSLCIRVVFNCMPTFKWLYSVIMWREKICSKGCIIYVYALMDVIMIWVIGKRYLTFNASLENEFSVLNICTIPMYLNKWTMCGYRIAHQKYSDFDGFWQRFFACELLNLVTQLTYCTKFIEIKNVKLSVVTVAINDPSVNFRYFPCLL